MLILKNLDGEIIYSGNEVSIKEAIEKNSINLSEANLSGADLSKANLSRADLSGADLSWADLSKANLFAADLSKADLSWADLSKANLFEADLAGADLSEANLSKADLSKANLSQVNKILLNSTLTILRHQKFNLIVYKYLLNNMRSPYKGFKYEVGKVYIADSFDVDERNCCGGGLNVATLEWCLKDTNFNIVNMKYVMVEVNPKDIIAIPYNSDGKFRVKKLKILKALSKKYLQTFINKNMIK